MDFILRNKKIIASAILCLVIIGIFFYFVKVRNPEEYRNQKILDLVAVSSKKMDGEFNATKKINDDLLGQYFLLKNSNAGGNLSTSTKIALVDTIIKNNLPDIKAKTYSISDLCTINKEDSASLKKYGNALGYILVKDSQNTTKRNEIFILQDALRKNDKNIIKQLDPIIEGYSNIIKDYLAIEVPKSASSFHLSLINNTSKVLSDVQNMRIVFDDPAKSITGISAYKADAKNLALAIYNTVSYFKEKKVNFIKTEYGYIFTSLIK